MRSDCLIPRIKDKVLELLRTTTLSNEKIGKIVGCSRGPINKIYKESGITIRGIKHLPRKCKSCKKEFLAVHSKERPNRGKFCSKECYTKWQKSEDNKGPNNPSWRGGCEPPSQLVRKTDEWKNWRRQVFGRDNYTCKKCGSIGGLLHPHHLIPKSVDKTKIYDLSNGITLCQSCHLKLHNENKINEFLVQPHKMLNQFSIKEKN